LGLAGGGMASLGRVPWLASAAAAEARDTDLLVLNAKVYTVDSVTPRADAFLVRAGRFVAVGSNDEAKSLAVKGSQIFDANQMAIVPGFIDCHNHAPGETLLYDVLVGNPFDVEFVTVDGIIDKLRKRASEMPAGVWVEGQFFDDTKVSDKRELSVRDLDKASRDHPIEVHHRGGHTSYYNSKAFELAGITRDTPNPYGGTFDHDENGELSGRVTDNARTALRKIGKRLTFTSEQKMQRSRDGAAHISKQFARYGLTGVSHQGGDLLALQQIRARGELMHRVSYEANGAVLDAMVANGIETFFGDEWLRFGATFEHIVDGSFSERTMALSTPYPGVQPPYKGNITETQGDLNDWIEKIHRAGIQVNCHANGDVAIEMVLSAVERAQKLYPIVESRAKITHCTLINDDLLRRIKAAGIIPTPFTTYAYYNSDKFKFYGEEILKRCMAYRSFLDAGIPVAAGSDFGPGPFAPLMGIQGMVTRTGWNGETWGANQRITVEEALRVNTINGAYASREETIKGSITPGKLADFVVLADDPHIVDPNRIKDIEIVRTVTGGNTTYQA
jgi:predicted amidohydrolase YtcJ